MIFLKKIHGNMTFSSNFLKRWSFQNGPCRGMIFLVLSGKIVFFFLKHDIFSWGRKWEMAFLKKYMGIWYFLCNVQVLQTWCPAPLPKKSQRWSYLAKIHLKVIHALGWHSGKSSSNSLYFHGDFYRCFHILFSSKKNQET